MSFKSWSEAQKAPGKNQADGKTAAAPAVAAPVAQSDKTAEKTPADKA